MNGLIKFALGLANVPSNMVTDIEAALPGASRLVDAAKQFAPMLQQAQPHIEAISPHLTAILPHVEALMPLINKALPILKSEYPDIVALLPTAQEIIAFVSDKKKVAESIRTDSSRTESG